MQRCFDVPEPKLRNKLTCAMLVHSSQTTFHRKIIYNFVWTYLGRSSRPDVLCKKGILRNITKLIGKNLCQGIFFNKVAGLCKKRDSGTGVFSGFCEISNNTIFYRTPPVAEMLAYG